MNKVAILLASAAALAACSSTPKSCVKVSECAAGQRCASGTCQDVTANGAVGDSCRSNADCSAGLICDTPANGFPEGMCTAACTSNSGCTASTCAPIATGGVCAAACTTDADCRVNYGCCPTLGNVCVPPGACTPAACTRPIAASTLDMAGSQVLHLGSHKVGDAVTFAVPAGTGSLTIVHQAELANLQVVYKNQVLDNSAVPLTITKPDGTIAYDDNVNPVSSPDGGTEFWSSYSFFGGNTPTTGAFTIPNTTASLDAGVPAGNWKMVVNDFAFECTTLAGGCNDGGTASNTYDISVLLRPLPAGNNLDVAFYIVGDVTVAPGVPFNAASAATNPSAQRMVQTLKSIYAAAGITVRNVTFFDVSAADRARFGTNVDANLTGPCDELDQMFTLSSAHPGNTLNLFLVQSIRQGGTTSGGTIVGIDGTIPGPSTLSGTVHSGAAVSMADLFTGPCGGAMNLSACGADRVAYIAAHEGGHYLGLFHLTEMEGADFDTLSDTPKCPCTQCASATDLPHCGGTGVGAPVLFPGRCVGSTTCGGGDYLMFWIFDGTVSQGKISAQEAQVMRLNPLVQP